MKPALNDCSVLKPEKSKGSQSVVKLLGFDRLGLTNDVLNALGLDGRAWPQGVRLESDSVRSEGHLRL